MQASNPTDSARSTSSARGDTAELVISARDLHKTYGSGHSAVHALRGVDLDVCERDLIVLLGPSGSGKTTFLHMLGALEYPTQGSVVFEGTDLAKATPEARTLYRREHVGFVFQFYNLVPSLTAEENISLVTDIAKSPMDPRDALALVGLDARRDHFPSELSGGEQQRVAIARAIAKRPRLLLCDEPTGALDVRTGRLVLAAIETVTRELGTATVIITHNAAIAGMGTSVARFGDGRVVERQANATRTSPEDISW